ncbi:MAG: autotransporter assembly complex family protein, partial [Kiloniellales bacterium]|nr:autotransporter assembly complex family protein [Kiloniellales bacterium]
PATAQVVNSSRETLLRLLAENARPLAALKDQEALVDHARKVMMVTLEIDPGPHVHFGPLTLQGLESVEPDYIMRALNWPRGEPFDRTRIQQLRRRLSDMNLFDTIRVELATQPDENGELPATMTLLERKHKSIGFGASFSSDEGFGGEVFWEHRNLLGKGERLRTSLNGTEIRQSAIADYEKPNYLVLDQSLLLRGELRHQDSDAFREKTIEGFVGLRREFDELWSGSLGLRPEITRVDDNESDEESYLGLGLPVTATRDSSDNLLDPRDGTRLTLGLTPNVGEFSGPVAFLSSEARASAYWTPLESDVLTFAGRTRIASIVGEETEDIPAHRRIYSGGGGSIRGYEFQSVGPLAQNNDPEGGRSALELGLEARFRFQETYGVVPFIEGGTAYDENFPDFEQTIRWAAGIGLRYYTVAGPLRFDIAFPINPRRTDENFEFYISFGQAF